MVGGKGRQFGSREVQLGSGKVTLVSVAANGMALVGLDGHYVR